jgi:CRP/FNR family cyclic AMP-dependent transcriptional regulator
MRSPPTVRLLEIEPDIARFLPAHQQAEAERLTVPALDLERGTVDIEAVLAEAGAFAGVVLDGMLLHRLRVGDQPASRLLGPGDIVSLRGAQHTMLLADSSYRAAADTRLALLGDEVLIAGDRWPRLVVGIQSFLAQQSERLAAQFVICQLPRVDQRLLALMWLLAESWGQVTSLGTALPLNLTHDLLGELIGARRSTVTLALGELSDRGAVVRQDRGWLLLEGLPEPDRPVPGIEQPVLLPDSSSAWADARERESSAEAHAELRLTVARLQAEHEQRVNRHRARVTRMMGSRERSREVRRRVARDALTRRGAPSS